MIHSSHPQSLIPRRSIDKDDPLRRRYRFRPRLAITSFGLIARILIGGGLVWSALLKFQNPYDFLANVYDFQLTSPRMGLFVSVALPGAELITGLFLLSGVLPGGALLGSFFLGAIFVFVQASALSRGLTIDCGCFPGISPSQPVSFASLARASLIVIGSISALAALRIGDEARSGGPEGLLKVEDSTDPAS